MKTAIPPAKATPQVKITRLDFFSPCTMIASDFAQARAYLVAWHLAASLKAPPALLAHLRFNMRYYSREAVKLTRHYVAREKAFADRSRHVAQLPAA